jgi:predicted TIM-barrel fold metal-dependent hydrolase
MDIVDSQLHLGPDPVEPTLKAMDAINIRSVLIEEFWITHAGKGPAGPLMPGFALPNGAWRSVYPTALSANLRYPDRFAYYVRLDRRDPDLETHMRQIAAHPGARGYRLLATWSAEEASALANGGFDRLFDIAQDIGLPVCVFAPGHAELLPRYLRAYPRLQFILDHIGMGMPHHPPGRAAAEQARTMDPAYFDEVLKLADYPNLALKLCHAPMLLRGGTFPFEGVRPYIRRAIQAFGAARLMWASDSTVMPHYPWADLLNYLLFDPELSPDEKAAILGRTARKLFNWPLVEPAAA